MEEKKESEIKKIVMEIALDISLANLSKKYFERSRSWLHHKLDGTDSKGGFTKEETQTLKTSLKDLARRINDCADKL